MGALWLTEGGVAIDGDGNPYVCDECPCEGGDLECQCIMHYYAVWCYEYWDWEYHPGRWLTTVQVQACIGGLYTLVNDTGYIFHILNDTGDGCLRTGGGITPGWTPGWCDAGSLFPSHGPGCAACPPMLGSRTAMDIFVGPAGCENCADTPPLDMSKCTRPLSFEALPDITIIPPC